MDAAVVEIGPPCFRNTKSSPALLAYRYITLFCVKDLSMSDGPAAEEKKKILGWAILVRLSELLFRAVEIIRDCGGERPRDSSLAETAILYYCLNDVCRDLKEGDVRPMLVCLSSLTNAVQPLLTIGR